MRKLSKIALVFLLVLSSIVTNIGTAFAIPIPESEYFNQPDSPGQNPRQIGQWLYELVDSDGQHNSEEYIDLYRISDSPLTSSTEDNYLTANGFPGYSNTFKISNSLAFNLESLELSNRTSNETLIKGYLNGAPVQGAEKTVFQPIYSGGVVTFSESAWSNINEIRLSLPNGMSDILFEIDDLIVSPAIEPASPPTAINISNSTIWTSAPVNISLGILSATDPDMGDTHTYTLVPGEGDTNNADFSISGNEVRTAVSLAGQEGTTKSIRVRATDSAQQSYEQAFTISIVDGSPIITAQPQNVVGEIGQTVFISVGATTFDQQTSPYLSYAWEVDRGTGYVPYPGNWNEIDFILDDTILSDKYRVTVTDTRTNQSVTSNEVGVFLDEALELVSLSPADDSTNVALDATFEMTFNLPVTANQGGYILIRDTNGDPIMDFDSILLSDTSRVQIDGTKVRFTSSFLEKGKSYHILTNLNPFTSTTNKVFGGITSDTTWNFSTVSGSSNADLTDITVSAGTLEYLTDVSTYSISLPLGTKAFTVTPTLSDPQATLAINESSATSGEATTIQVSDNTWEAKSGTVTIVVTAEDGETTKTYTINYTRPQGTVPLTLASDGNGTAFPEEGLVFDTKLYMSYIQSQFYRDIYISKPNATIDITNFAATLSGPNAGNFVLGTVLPDNLAAGTGNAVLKLRPKAFLTPGTYTATLTLSSDQTEDIQLPISFTVEPHPNSSITLNPEGSYNFNGTDTPVRYFERTYTIPKLGLQLTKTGNLYADVPDFNAAFDNGENTAFTTGTIRTDTLAPGTGSTVAQVGVKSGLQDGTYTDTLRFYSGDTELASIELTVTISPEHTVEFRDSETHVFEFQQVQDEATATAPQVNPTREGYTFGGWYTSLGFYQPFDFTTPITSDTVLYAKWLSHNSLLELRYPEMDQPFDFNPETFQLDNTYFTTTYSQINFALTPQDENVKRIEVFRDGVNLGCIYESYEYIYPFDRDGCVNYDLWYTAVQDGDQLVVTAEDPAEAFQSTYSIFVADAAFDDTGMDGYMTAFNTQLQVLQANGVFKNDDLRELFVIRSLNGVGSSFTAHVAEDGQPENGELLLFPDGSFVYTPDATFEGTDTFSYYIEYMTQDYYPGSVSVMAMASDSARSNTASVSIIVEEEPHFTMTFQPNNGEETFTEQESTNPDTDQLILGPEQDPTRTGYTFAGWFYDDNTFENQVTFPVNITEDVTVYAKWELNSYVITFDENQGSPVADPMINHFDTVTAPADPTRTGYTFLGWYNGDELYDFDTIVTGPLTLTAKWELNMYTIRFETGEGTPVPDQTVAHFDQVDEPISVREGYTLAGWLLDGERYDFAAEVSGPMTLEALWLSQNTDLTLREGATIQFDEANSLITGAAFDAPLIWLFNQIAPEDENISSIAYFRTDGDQIFYLEPNEDNFDEYVYYLLFNQLIQDGDYFIVTAEDGLTTHSYTVRLALAAFADSYATDYAIELDVSAEDGLLANDNLLNWQGGMASIQAVAPTGGYAIEVTSGPTKGTVDVNPDGSFTYTPSIGSTGSDSFMYRIVYTQEEMPVYTGYQPADAAPSLEPGYSNEAEVTIAIGLPEVPTPPTPPSDGEIIVVDEDNPTDILIRLLINRIQTGQGFEDLITMDSERVRQALESLSQDTSRVIIPTRPDNPVTQITLPTSAQDWYEFYLKNLSFELPYLEMYMLNNQINGLSGDLTIRFNELLLASQVDPIRTGIQQLLNPGDTFTMLNNPVQVDPNLPLTNIRLGLPIPLSFPVADYGTLRVFVVHSDGTTEWLTVTVENGMAYFTTPKFSTFTLVSVEEAEVEGDLPYIRGFEDNTFRPGVAVTRHQIAAMFARKLSGNNIPVAQATFTDTRGSWAKNEIEYVRANGIMNGVSATTFNPTAPMTRAQIAVTADRYLQKVCGMDMASSSYCGNMSMGSGYTDVRDDEWGAASIKRIQALGIITGYNDGTFRPSEYVTRAQVVTIINRLFEMTPAASYDAPSFTDVSPSYWAYLHIERATRGK